MTGSMQPSKPGLETHQLGRLSSLNRLKDCDCIRRRGAMLQAAAATGVTSGVEMSNSAEQLPDDIGRLILGEPNLPSNSAHSPQHLHIKAEVRPPARKLGA